MYSGEYMMFVMLLWASIPKVVRSIPTVVRHIFKQHNTNTENSCIILVLPLILSPYFALYNDETNFVSEFRIQI
jgi:hypothetical protein